MGDSRQGDVSEVGGARRRDGLEEEFRFLVEAAQVYGAEVAALIPSTDVVADERVTLKCAVPVCQGCLLYTSDAADDLTRVDLGGRRIIKKKKNKIKKCQ